MCASTTLLCALAEECRTHTLCVTGVTLSIHGEVTCNTWIKIILPQHSFYCLCFLHTSGARTARYGAQYSYSSAAFGVRARAGVHSAVPTGQLPAEHWFLVRLCLNDALYNPPCDLHRSQNLSVAAHEPVRPASMAAQSAGTNAS